MTTQQRQGQGSSGSGSGGGGRSIEELKSEMKKLQRHCADNEDDDNQRSCTECHQNQRENNLGAPNKSG